MVRRAPVGSASDSAMNGGTGIWRPHHVVGAKGQLTGVVSFDDVLDVIAAEMGETSGAVRDAQQIENALSP